MEFISLDAVLNAIGACISVPESAKLGADEPVWAQKINESYYQYSKAAALLDHHLVTSKHSPLPRWLDTRDGTGYPRPSDVAREEGMKFLLEQAKWYPQWLQFNQKFRIRRLNTIGRWATAPSGEDYSRECPKVPYAPLVHEIGFEVGNIRDFLDLLAIPHVLGKADTKDGTSMSADHLPMHKIVSHKDRDNSPFDSSRVQDYDLPATQTPITTAKEENGSELTVINVREQMGGGQQDNRIAASVTPKTNEATSKEDSQFPQGLRTPDMAAALAGLPARKGAWDRDRWTKCLQSARWVQKAKMKNGARGKAAAIWNPVEVATMAIEQRGINIKKFSTLFRDKKSAVYPWLEEWKKFEDSSERFLDA